MDKVPLLKQILWKSCICNKLKRSITANLNNCRTNIVAISTHSTKTNEGVVDDCVSDSVRSERCVKNTLQRNYAGCKKTIGTGVLRLNVLNSLTRQTVYSKHLTHTKVATTYTNHVRDYCSELENEGNDIDVDEEDDAENIKQGEGLLRDDAYNECVKQYCSLPDVGHRVFVLQIEVTGALRTHNTSGELQLSENVALVYSIPGWTVVDTEIVKVKEPRSIRQMMKAFEYVTEKIKTTPMISAVFISRNTFTAEQLVLAQNKWHLPVFDRSFILTQVFKAQAQTREAKLHVALAELPFLRFCMAHGFQPGQYGKSAKSYIRWPFAERERKLKAALASLEKERSVVRNRRSTRQIPTIAVIGYTNCGKTTLIKSLTGDEKMIPQDKLFATLDVTAHGGLLPNNMMVVYMDTVGFLTDLPVSLKSAFTVTLEDTLNADLIIHVRDVSHPDVESQKLNVEQSIQKMLPTDKLETMIEVCNKVDRIDESQRPEVLSCFSSPDVFCVSAVTGEGMEELTQVIQERLLQNIDFLQKKIKVPQNGPYIGWLHREATVVSMETDDSDQECLIMNVYISKANYSKFLAHFGPKKLKTKIMEAK